MDRLADIFAGLTMVALVTTLVSHRNTARVVTAVGTAYANAVTAAMGRG
jgi:hypothetical protein